MRQTAIFAAGCFWGAQYYFDQISGVIETEAGYIGGNKENPGYWDVASHQTGHAEAVKIVFNPVKVTYEKLLAHFFMMHDPTQLNRQGPDVGDEYRSAIFYLDESQKTSAERMIAENNKYKSGAKIVTTIEPAGKFWLAEPEHQKFSQRTGIGMCHVPYRSL